MAEVGAGVTRWKPGDKCCALTNGGGYAQYAIALEPLVLPIPAGYDLKQAACLPEAMFTAWFNVFHLGRLAKGDTLPRPATEVRVLTEPVPSAAV